MDDVRDPVPREPLVVVVVAAEDEADALALEQRDPGAPDRRRADVRHRSLRRMVEDDDAARESRPGEHPPATTWSVPRRDRGQSRARSPRPRSHAGRGPGAGMPQQPELVPPATHLDIVVAEGARDTHARPAEPAEARAPRRGERPAARVVVVAERDEQLRLIDVARTREPTRRRPRCRLPPTPKSPSARMLDRAARRRNRSAVRRPVRFGARIKEANDDDARRAPGRTRARGGGRLNVQPGQDLYVNARRRTSTSRARSPPRPTGSARATSTSTTATRTCAGRSIEQARTTRSAGRRRGSSSGSTELGADNGAVLLSSARRSRSSSPTSTRRRVGKARMRTRQALPRAVGERPLAWSIVGARTRAGRGGVRRARRRAPLAGRSRRRSASTSPIRSPPGGSTSPGWSDARGAGRAALRRAPLSRPRHRPDGRAAAGSRGQPPGARPRGADARRRTCRPRRSSRRPDAAAPRAPSARHAARPAGDDRARPGAALRGRRDRRGAGRRAARRSCERRSRRTTARAASARSRSSTATPASGEPGSRSSTRSSTRTRPRTSRSAGARRGGRGRRRATRSRARGSA